MPLITKFYDDYLEHADTEPSAEKEAFVDYLKGTLSTKEFIQAESLATLSEDKACEEAFTAGFKTAMTLWKEVLS